jgi:formylglycine-generating enzyme required for sulfatase activity
MKKNHVVCSLSFMVIICLSICLQTTYGNDIEVLNACIIERNSTEKYAVIEFDLSWANSFRTTTEGSNNNWDAAWVFVKWRKSSESTASWSHGTLKNTGHTIPRDVLTEDPTEVSYTYSLPSDYKGIFIYRSDTGTTGTGYGDTNLQNVKIAWNYGGTGGDGLNNQDQVDLHLFAIEMVYVPQGSFKLGGGSGSESGKFYQYPTTSTSYTVSSESAITVGTSAGNLYYGGSGDGAGPIPANFPKGYNAFYCMKYEISQGQYLDFLNHLDSTEQGYRIQTPQPCVTSTSPAQQYVMVGPTTYSKFQTQYRNGICCEDPKPSTGPITFYCDLDGDGTGNESTDGINTACNYMLWTDIAAYLDWAALRPMTELEFEKAARGTNNTVANEYAWGSTSIKKGFSPPFYIDNYNLTSIGQPSEYVSDPATGTTGNAVYSSTQPTSPNVGPLRTGIFATASTTRPTSGGSYWGIMELSGNVDEWCVTAGHSQGRSYTGLHGDGVTSSGGANVSNWPGILGSQYGMGKRGGSFISPSTSLRISDRSSANNQAAGDRHSYGGRGVRTAP